MSVQPPQYTLNAVIAVAVIVIGALSLLIVGLGFLRSYKRLRSTDIEAVADPTTVEPFGQVWIELKELRTNTGGTRVFVVLTPNTGFDIGRSGGASVKLSKL